MTELPDYKPLSVADFPELPKAQKVLRANRTRLPYVVEFAGLPKAGKTTIMRRTVRALERLGLNCSTVSEAATTKIHRSHRSDLLAFNVLCTIENIRSLIVESKRRGSVDVCVMDRGVTDSLVWLEFLKRRGLLAKHFADDIATFAKVPAWYDEIRLLVYIENDWASYQERFKIDSPIEQQPAFNEKWFDDLSQCYEEILHSPGGDRKPLRIDGRLPKGLVRQQVAAPQVLEANWTTASCASTRVVRAILDGLIESGEEQIAVIPAGDNAEQFSEMSGDALGGLVRDLFGRDDGGKPIRPRRGHENTLSWRLRDEVEDDPRFVQLVAGAYIRRNGDVLVLQHAGSEKRDQLRGRLSLLVTGHVSTDDRSLSYGGRHEIENCLLRELKEELVHLDLPAIRPAVAVRIGDDEMGRRHMGLIFEVQTNSSLINVSGIPGGGDFDMDPEFVPISKLSSMMDRLNPWSQRVAQHLLGQAM